VDYIFLLILGTACAGLLAWGLTRPGGICEFPFLAGAVFGGWVLPQAVGLLNDTTLPAGALTKTLLMSVLCLAMGVAGYRVAGRVRGSPLLWEGMYVSERRITMAAAGMAVLGSYFLFMIGRLPSEMTAGAWSGLPVRYHFFGKMVNVGFALGVILYLTTRSRLALGAAFFAGTFLAQKILFGGRRGVAVEFAMVVLCGLWFVRRWTPPRWSVPVLLTAGTLFTFSTGQYRSSVLHRADASTTLTQRILRVDYTENMNQVLTQGAPELRNAAFRIASKDRNWDFDYGRSLWNSLVFRYVPAQIVSRRAKESLLFELPPEEVSSTFGYIESFGTTRTGMSDTFESFWYFGSITFFLIGYVMHRLYGAAEGGCFVSQVFYVLVVGYALHAITHSTHWFWLAWPHMLLFMVPVLVWSRARIGDRLPVGPQGVGHPQPCA
jgi:hypothetical protein